jgi:hypothetical protein
MITCLHLCQRVLSSGFTMASSWISPNVPTDATTIIYVFGTIFCLLNVASCLRAYKRLSRFPGPPLASISRLYSVKAFLSGKEHELMRESHEKYGKQLDSIVGIST